MKKILLFFVLILSLHNTSAFRIEFGNNIIISKPVFEDLYIAGGNITINAPIYGDLIIAGGTIIINDTVSNDILLVGGTVTVNGFVGDDIRCAGGNIKISKNVTGDVIVTGGAVIIDKEAAIGGLLATGGDVTIDGIVNGEIKGAFGDLFINGNVAKNIDCRGGRITVNSAIGGKSILSARHIVIGNYAAFTGDVRYWNKKESVDFKHSLKNSKAVFDPSLRISTGEWYYLGSATILGLLWYLGMALLMILIIQYLFSGTMKKAADTVFNSVLKSGGYGFLFCIAMPAVAVIACITIIGLPVGVLLIFSYIVLILLATVITSVVAANWFNNRFDKKWNLWQITFTAFGIFIFFKFFSAIPFAGWLAMILMVCIAFGGILINVNWRGRRNHVTVN